MSDADVDKRQSIATEAADWYARLRSENISELDAVRFRAWLAGDPARRREFEAIDALWEELSAIEQSPQILDIRASLAGRRRTASSPLPGEVQRRTRVRRAVGTLSAAAAVMLVAVMIYSFVQSRGSISYVTGIGEQRSVPLDDGSIVTLNTATRIRVHYSPQQREIELLAGQANFQVFKDPQRPFVVKAGGGAVRALGTVFDVQKMRDQVRVTLLEGKVVVRPTDAAESTSTQRAEGGPQRAMSSGTNEHRDEFVLTAGQQLAFEAGSGAVERGTVDVQRAAAWRERKLDFSNTPLSEVIAEANRYSREQIVLDAPSFQSARISGTFEAGRNELLVEGLQSFFHFRVEREAGRIVLTSPDAADLTQPSGRSSLP